MKSKWIISLAISASLFACPDGGNGGTGGGSAQGGGTASGGGAGGGDSGGFKQPSGTVAVNFSIDDTANKVFKAGEMDWKGSFKYDETTRIVAKSAWEGPFPKLYDDGPWTATGHEPKGSTAGDNKWGVTVFIVPPATGMDTYEYGLQDATTQGWIWPSSSNGTFSVAAGATAEIEAPGAKLKAFGTNDVKLVLDKNNLATRPPLADGGTGTWDTSTIKVKGSGWSWAEVELKDDGQNGDDTAADGKYTFILSNSVGAGKTYPHSGLANSGDKVEFIFVVGGVEYKDVGGNGEKKGVTGFTKASGGSFTAATVEVLTANKNTYVAIP